DPGQPGERPDGHVTREAQLDLMVGHVAQRLDAIDPDQAAVADDRDAVARPLDLAEDVAREEHRPALRLRLADDLVAGLLDERVEAGRRLVEDEQVGPVLERDDQPDLLFVALRELAELARGVDIEARDQLLLVRRVDATAEVREILDRLATGELVVERELA